MKKMADKNFITLGIIVFSVIFSILLLNLTSGIVNVIAPINGTNSSGSITLNLTYSNTTDVTAINSSSSGFYQNGTGTRTSITCTGWGCSTTACWCSATASALSDGKDQLISATLTNLSNGINQVNSTGNTTLIDFYTNNISCSFGLDGRSTVEYY